MEINEQVLGLFQMLKHYVRFILAYLEHVTNDVHELVEAEHLCFLDLL